MEPVAGTTGGVTGRGDGAAGDEEEEQRHMADEIRTGRVELEVAGRTLSIETGRLARQAGGAVVVRYGDTMVLVTATMSAAPREGVDFLPLTCD